MKKHLNAICFLLAGLSVSYNSAGADALPPDLDTALTDLRNGRIYQLGFPPRLVNGSTQGKTQRQVRDDYLGVTKVDSNTVPNGAPKFDSLQSAVDRAVVFRNASYSLQTDKEDAQELAWQALESLLQGQLIAGNANLLKGLRVAFPNDGPEKPGGERVIPFGCPQPSNPQDRVPITGEYRGANIADLCYARAHFFRGIVAALDFMANDIDGKIRAIDRNRPLLQYTRFNDAQSFPRLADPNFQGPVDIQTAGYLLGNLVDRYGKAIVGIGDHLWRAAYFDKRRAPGGSKAQERPEMLEAAMQQLQKGAHAQYLASLPLAATFDEGELGYELCRVDQARVSIASAGTFIDRLRRGEVPKLDAVSIGVSTNQIGRQLDLVNQAKDSAANAYGMARDAIWKVKDSEAAVAGQATQIRTQFKTALTTAVALDPDGMNLDGTISYAGLETAEGRVAYRADVRNVLAQLLAAGPFSDQLVSQGELGQTILQFNRALAEVRSAKNRIDSIPQQIRIEEERVGAVNGVILGTTDRITSYQLSLGIANSISISAGAGTISGPFFSVNFNPNAIVAAVFQNKITRAQAIQTVEINNINAAATIRNLLLQQNQYVIDLDQAVINGQLAIANLNALLARIDRLIEDRLYYKTVNDSLWYYDPALVFEQETAEITFANDLDHYKRQLYFLAQSLASRWCEPFSNPVKIDDTVLQNLDNQNWDDFTQAESIFNIWKNDQGNDFLGALANWEFKLHSSRTGGQRILENSIISLRKDIFGFSEIIYDPAIASFRIHPDPAYAALQVNRFRALLLRNLQPAGSGYWLRLEFPLTWGQVSRSAVIPGPDQPFVVKSSPFDWNIRITSASAKIVGLNVAPANLVLPVQLYQNGKVELPQYFPRSNVPVKQRPEFSSFNLPLYYDDPQRLANSPFKISFNAGLNGNDGGGTFEDNVELSPFCDQYVLLIPRGGEVPLLNVGNISDIQITFSTSSGKPSTRLLP